MKSQKPKRKNGRTRDPRSFEVKAELLEAFAERTQNDALLEKRSYFSYLSALLRGTQLYHLVSHYLNLFRKFRLVSFLFRIYSYLLVLLQLGTAFVVVAIGLLILLPIFLLSVTCVLFSALVLYRRENKAMEQILEHQKIVILFPTRDGELNTGRFWRAHIEELSTHQNHTILIVSPYFWSAKGLESDQFYFLLRKEKENIYLLRRHYYFSLKKKILEKRRDSLVLIY